MGPLDSSSDDDRHATVSSAMPAAEIIQILVKRNCPNITPNLNLDQCTSQAVACGGFGDVFKGALANGTRVAIKCPRIYLQQDDTKGHKVLKHAARELYIWSRLKHENVLELLGLAEYQGRMAMVSPWMANGTLLEYIGRHSDMNRRELLTQICRGVAYLHAQNTVHGDLKSGNILVSRNGVVKIADFGCTVLKKSQTLQFTTSTTNPAISARWTAPEVLRGKAGCSKEADVYSLGMIFLEVTTGHLPFSDTKQDLIVMTQVLDGRTPTRPPEFTSLSGLQADLLWKLLGHTWAPKPSERPSVGVIQSRLNEIELAHAPAPVVARKTSLSDVGVPILQILIMGAKHEPLEDSALRTWAGAVGASPAWGEVVVDIINATRGNVILPMSSSPEELERIGSDALRACALLCFGVAGSEAVLAKRLEERRWGEDAEAGAAENWRRAHAVFAGLAAERVPGAAAAIAKLEVQQASKDGKARASEEAMDATADATTDAGIPPTLSAP